MKKFDDYQYIDYCNFNTYVFCFPNSIMAEINLSPIDLFEGESESDALIFIADLLWDNHLCFLRYFIFEYYIFYFIYSNVFMILLC